jgi:multidrug efflux pump subunit AcrB
VIGTIDIILLIGIVKEERHYAGGLRLHAQRERGFSSEDAIHEACLLRFRPILMSTLLARCSVASAGYSAPERAPRSAPAARLCSALIQPTDGS